MFFCFKTKEKNSRLETSAKILNNFLKFPNSGGKKTSVFKKNFCRHSNTGNFLTLPFPKSKCLSVVINSELQYVKRLFLDFFQVVFHHHHEFLDFCVVGF